MAMGGLSMRSLRVPPTSRVLVRFLLICCPRNLVAIEASACKLLEAGKPKWKSPAEGSRMTRRLLIATFGSYGDLYPYLAIGAELRRRGLGVTIATSSSYQTIVEAEGLAFHAVRPDVDLNDRAKMEYFMDARRGSERIIRFLTGLVRENYEDTLEAARDADVIITHPITFGAVLAAQKLRLPWISTVLAPMSMLSACDPPVMADLPGMVHILRLGPGIAKWFWNLGRKRTRPWVQPVLDLQKELDLPPGGHPLFEGQHSPSLVLALFSRSMAAPQPDWPAQTVVTGFPFYDHGEIVLDPAFNGAPELCSYAGIAFPR